MLLGISDKARKFPRLVSMIMVHLESADDVGGSDACSVRLKLRFTESSLLAVS